MADDIIKWETGQTYEAVGLGGTGVAIVNEHAYRAIRIAITDTPPDPGHVAFHLLKGREGTAHYEVPTGFTVYVRADTEKGLAHGHARRFTS